MDKKRTDRLQGRCRSAATEAMTPEYLAKPLTPFPLPTTDGLMLRTIGDIGAYILALPKRRKRLAHWEQVRRLIVKEAGGATVTQQVRYALSKRQARPRCV